VRFVRYGNVPAAGELEAKIIVVAKQTLVAELFKAGEVTELVDGGPNYNGAPVTEADLVRGLQSETLIILSQCSTPLLRFTLETAL
jgi:hypothetical protein